MLIFKKVKYLEKELQDTKEELKRVSGECEAYKKLYKDKLENIIKYIMDEENNKNDKN